MDSSLWEKYPLLNTMMKLRKSRFNAAERLGKRYRWHSIALVVFSIYVLALSLIPRYFPIQGPPKPDIIGFAAIVSSVFVTALSVYAAFSEDVVRGKYLHDNAKSVTNLYHEYKVTVDQYENKGGAAPDTLAFEARYNATMDSCPYNHDQIDYQSIRSELEKLKLHHKFFIELKVLLNIYLWPVIAITGPIILLTIGFWIGPK